MTTPLSHASSVKPFPSFLTQWTNASGIAWHEKIAGFDVAATSVACAHTPKAFQETLFEKIANAQRRVFMSALYVQDDEAGRAFLNLLYDIKAARPDLEIVLFVDWHRAQRGLIGKAKSEGNAALYKAMAQAKGAGVAIYGIPVQTREFLGVMHLKGVVIDDTVIYSGASINDVYLRWQDRYRLDRYHVIESPALADAMIALMNDVLRAQSAVLPLNTPVIPKTKDIRSDIAFFRKTLAKAAYSLPVQNTWHRPPPGTIRITPLLGFGQRRNLLNHVILSFIQNARSRLVIFTPYFNPPGKILRALSARLKAGCQITLIVGDKHANDFFIPQDEPFRAIGVLPYLYELNLRRFCQKHQKKIEADLLHIHLWSSEAHSFHLKGMWADEASALLTGHNLNPRAWRLDLENALLIHDTHQLLKDMHQEELRLILANTRRLSHFSELEEIAHYPQEAQKLLKRLQRVRADRLVNQIL